ncbi:helix-turn-helix domain-containing protein [Salipiger thiooxidans]|uniref:helix-turn-helix domain-containing protein n=1 Tax=Salipiger thiooxidans TaxID=282683 RepID=UPI001CD7E0AF|nr:helix-turn-helix domain-containing protein [Salipiger thiooxidans]MCA0846091.1 helix-turn-helix domain-containing protein [Salipiger thiooxidans]
MSIIPSRQDDERVLQMIKLRHEGKSSRVIAERMGMSPESVRAMTNKVRNADEKMEGADLSAFYWQ